MDLYIRQENALFDCVHRRAQRRNLTQVTKKFLMEQTVWNCSEVLSWNWIFIGFSDSHRNDGTFQWQRLESCRVLIFVKGGYNTITDCSGVAFRVHLQICRKWPRTHGKLGTA